MHRTVKQVAEAVALPQRRIQFYVDQGLVAPEGGAGGGRGRANRFSIKNIIEFSLVGRLGMIGMTLAAVRSVLRWHPAGGNESIAEAVLRVAQQRKDSGAWLAFIAFSDDRVQEVRYLQYEEEIRLGSLIRYGDRTGPGAYRFMAERELDTLKGIVGMAETAGVLAVLDLAPVVRMVVAIGEKQ